MMIAGLPDVFTEEAKCEGSVVIQNYGFGYLFKKITINLATAGILNGYINEG